MRLLVESDVRHLRLAAETFADMWTRTTGETPAIVSADDGSPELVVFGSSAESGLVAGELLGGRFAEPRLRLGQDDYYVQSHRLPDGRQTLLLAGGSVRAAFYAVYDFFERAAGCHYFWDGDVVPTGVSISLSGWAVVERPRFQYRGLRYFAHRSLDRFQAEHWDFEDWRRELDWVLKRRLNLTMLRIGQDDLFQRAFPDVVPYPDLSANQPESVPRSLDDRNLVWSLQVRGELRRQVLAYGRERGLFAPEDCGTMSHWYSRTPRAFLDHFRPDFLPQCTHNYGDETGRVWDIRQDENLERYFRLTETSVREYGSPEMFHTIGLAERNCFPTREENQRMKLYTLQRIISRLRRNWPHAPLLIASWDFFMYWRPEEVRELIATLNPENTVILDYTSDKAQQRNTFRDWGICGKFPWIFGIFQAYEASSEIRGQVDLIRERLPLAAADPMCRGLVLWPENSHQDTLMLDVFPTLAWNPDQPDIGAHLPDFCRRRYPAPALAEAMLAIWRELLPISVHGRWGGSDDGSCRELYPSPYFRLGVGSGSILIHADDRLKEFFRHVVGAVWPQLPAARDILLRLADVAAGGPLDDMALRDTLDIARTVWIRLMEAGLGVTLLAQDAWRDELPQPLLKRGGTITQDWLERHLVLLETFAADFTRLLEVSADFSLHDSLERLRRKHPTNPNFEHTLKGNAEDSYGYCRSFIYELALTCYEPALKAHHDRIRARLAAGRAAPAHLGADGLRRALADIRDAFSARPLADMAPDPRRALRELPQTLRSLAETLAKLKAARDETD